MNDDEEIGKYGQVVKVKTEPKKWRYQQLQTNPAAEQKEEKTREKKRGCAPYHNQSWNDKEMWEDRNQKWHQVGTWCPRPLETNAKPEEDNAILRKWERDTPHEISHAYKIEQNRTDDIHRVANAQQCVYLE